MRNVDLDEIRRALEAALQNLKDGAGDSDDASIALLTNRLVQNSGVEAPIIVVLANGSKFNKDDATQRTQTADTQVGSSLSQDSERKVSHPGHERFTIETGSNPSAPKACFMEPGRICVNSGACEMRGF